MQYHTEFRSDPPQDRACLRRVRNGSSWKRGPSAWPLLVETRTTGSLMHGSRVLWSRVQRRAVDGQPSYTVPNLVHFEV